MLIAKTGLRFSESLAITPEDFDFSNQILNISKTWNYKSPIGGFQPTKNKSSIRKIQMDWRTAMQFATLIKNLPQNEPIFVRGRIFNSTINDKLESYCADVSIPIISVHGLRHPYVKHTTKKYNSEKQKTQATKMDLIAWVFRFCIFNYSKRSWIL